MLLTLPVAALDAPFFFLAFLGACVLMIVGGAVYDKMATGETKPKKEKPKREKKPKKEKSPKVKKEKPKKDKKKKKKKGKGDDVDEAAESESPGEEATGDEVVVESTVGEDVAEQPGEQLPEMESLGEPSTAADGELADLDEHSFDEPDEEVKK